MKKLNYLLPGFSPLLLYLAGLTAFSFIPSHWAYTVSLCLYTKHPNKGIRRFYRKI